MNTQEWERRVYGCYAWLQESVPQHGIETFEESVAVCRFVLREMCPAVTGCCLQCMLHVFDVYVSENHSNKGCGAIMSGLRQRPLWCPDSDRAGRVARLLVRESQSFSKGPWPLLPATLMIVADDLAASVIEQVETMSGDYWTLGGLCARCLLDFDFDTLVAGHDDERCFVSCDQSNIHLNPPGE